MPYRILAFGDAHAPITHQGWFDWLIGQIEDFKPDAIVNVGDWFEALAAKRWARYPDEKWTAKEEVEEVVRQATAINEASPESRKVWLYGNHDDNLFGCLPDRIPIDLREIVNWRCMRGTEALEQWEEKTTYKHDFVFRLGPITFQHGCDVSKDGIRSMFDSAILYAGKNRLLVQGHSHKPIPPTECDIRSLPTGYWVANAGCGADWDRMHYMDRFQKAKWGRGCLRIETSRVAVKARKPAYAVKEWDAELTNPLACENDMNKPFFKSKTNLLAIVVALVGLVQAFQPLVTDPKVLGYVGLVIGFLTMLARSLGSNIGGTE